MQEGLATPKPHPDRRTHGRVVGLQLECDPLRILDPVHVLYRHEALELAVKKVQICEETVNVARPLVYREETMMAHRETGHTTKTE